MLTYVSSVDPHLGFLIYCAEMKEYSLSFKGIGNCKGAVIPYIVAMTVVIYARKLALIYERNVDLGIERRFVHPSLGNTLAFLVKGEIPSTVEAEPILSYSVGTGIFRAGNDFFCVHN